MSISNPFPKLPWALALGGLAGLGLGCVITVGQQDCSDCGNTGCNSQIVGDQCVCDPGYEFADPDDPDNFDCDRIPGKAGDESCGGNDNIHLEGEVCVCDNGYNWCNPSNLNDLTCCEDDNQAPGDGTQGDTDEPTTSDETADGTVDDTGEPTEMCEEVTPPGNGVEPDPSDCTEAGLVFCSNNAEEGYMGSRFWECDGTQWVENPAFGDLDCQNSGFDFSKGCIDNGMEVVFECEVGPGTPCSGPECDRCADDDVWEYCTDGKLAADSCLRICNEEGDDQGVTYDFGFCSDVDGVVTCVCCDEGQPDCPV